MSGFSCHCEMAVGLFTVCYMLLSSGDLRISVGNSFVCFFLSFFFHFFLQGAQRGVSTHFAIKNRSVKIYERKNCQKQIRYSSNSSKIFDLPVPLKTRACACDFSHNSQRAIFRERDVLSEPESEQASKRPTSRRYAR